MSAIFGIFDPDGQLRHREVAGRMAKALVKPPGADTVIEYNPLGCLGIVRARAGQGESWLRSGPHESLRAQLGVALRRDNSEVTTDFEQELSGRILNELRGHFVLACLDPQRGKLTLASDHFGGRPLYLYRHGGIVLFASQQKAVLAALNRRWHLDPASVASLLSFGEMLGNRTLVEGVATLPAATLFTIGRAGASYTTYWQYEHHPDRRQTWGEAVEASGRALALAVGRCLADRRDPAVPLSGGLDSRFILELAAKTSRPAAYTWGVPGCRDIRCARAVSRLLACPHQVHHFEPGYLADLGEKGVWITEGQTPATNFHVLPFVDRLAERGHDVVLDGFAGDAMLGGNFIARPWFDCADARRAGAALWDWRQRAFTGGRDFPQLAERVAFARESFISLYLHYPGATTMDRAMAFLFDNRVRRTTTCGSEIFRTRLPVRQPFMDPDFVATIARVPHAWRRHHRFYLDVFKAYAPKSAAAPYLRTLLPVRVPYALTWLSLAGHRACELAATALGLPKPFADRSPSDFPQWLRGALRVYVHRVLNSETCLERGILPAETVRRVLAEHFAGHFNHANLIGALLSLELFACLFLDDLPGSIERFSAAVPEPLPILSPVA